MQDDVPRMPKLLADAGYSTHLFGVQHEVDNQRPDLLGYQHREATGGNAVPLAEAETPESGRRRRERR